MRKSIFVSLAAMAAGLAVPASLSAQEITPADPPVVQTQANPPGEGIPTDVPPNPATASTPVAPAMPADPSYQAGPYAGALTPPPVQAMNKEYPLCSATVQDSCVNPSEAPASMKKQRRRSRG